MHARDWFGVGVRLIGVWQLTQAAYWGFYAVLKYNGHVGNPNIPPNEDVGIAIFYAALGLVVIILAGAIVRGVYGPLRSPTEESSDD
jgi:hypothetical protein